MKLNDTDLLELPVSLMPAVDDQAEVRVLLRGIANGDRVCYAEFHRRFSGMVYATAIQVLHNHEDAQDTAQEVFTSLWKKAKMFIDDRGKPSTWLAAMARNRSIDKLRSRQRRSRLNDSFEDESRTEEQLVRTDPAMEASVNELGQHVRSAVMELSPEQREAIQLAFFEGLTQLEIAQKTGEPLGTIKARIRRGLGRLRTMVKP
ncbi:MAG: sigma-70 family RNA polymerase sigma factor [Verrucomicrobiota bacterium]